MEVLPDHPLIKLTLDQVQKVREGFNVHDVARINEALDAVEEWAKKQDHLAEGCKYMTRGYLERVYILSCGSVEMTKKRLDKMFTTRFLMPEMCLNKTIQEFEVFYGRVIYIPLPKLHPQDLSRVMVTQFKNDDLEEFSIISYFRFAFLIGEYRLHYDYSCGDRFIIDMKNLNKLSLLAKLNPIHIKKADILCSEGYGTKIKGIHILNAPPFVDKFVFILKQALSAKVASRLFVHPDYQDLHKHVPKEILPEDYGGDELSCVKLGDQWVDTLRSEEASKLIANSERMVSDESKRNSSSFNQEYLGMPGSFRSLNMD